MAASLRSALIASAIGLTLVLLITVPASSETWSSGRETGMTSVRWSLDGGTYTWTLTNESSLPGDPHPSFDVLVWSLVPFQVQEPLSWTAPEGWQWAGNRWEIASSASEKYLTPCALAPGKSVEFRYMPDPEGELINAHGPQPSGLSFMAHVGAVVPGSGSQNGSVAWKSINTEQGRTWFDRPRSRAASSVPEPSGLLSTTFGLVGLAAHLLRRSRLRP